MKKEELSKEDQALLDTDFGADLEKQAAAEVEMVNELYGVGFEKLAAQAADELDKLAEESEKEEKEEGESEAEKKLDEGQKKEAAARGAFIARGYIDGLMKLGQDRHEDPLHYLYPALEEKLAAMGKDVAAMFAKAKKGVEGGAKKAVGAAKGYAGKVESGAKAAWTGKGKGGKALSGMDRAKAGAGAAGRVALPGLAAYGGYKAVSSDKK